MMDIKNVTKPIFHFDLIYYILFVTLELQKVIHIPTNKKEREYEYITKAHRKSFETFQSG